LNKCKPNFVYLNDANFSNIKDIKNITSYKIPISIDNYKCKSVLRSDYNIKDNDFVITLASRCIKYKGWEEAIEIFNKLNKKYEHLKLLLIGDLNSYGLELKNMCSNDNILFLGYQSNVKRFFEISNIGILPSYFYGESNPIVLIECLFSNKPFIASDIGDIYNMLKGDGELAGSVIKLCDGKINITSYVQEIEKYILNEDNLYENKIRQTKIASQKFNISTIGCKYLDMFLK
jgi:glycosyltransferase involved in cell wall biosynthesis